MDTIANSLGTNLTSLTSFGAELTLIGAVVVLFVLDLITRRSGLRKPILAGVAVAGVVLAGVSLAVQSVPVGSLFGGLLIQDSFALFFKWLLLAALLLGVLMAANSRELTRERFGEYLALLLTMGLGLLLMVSASDLLMVYLSIELVSLMSYLLAGYRRGDRKASEGALKYVLFGGVASGVMLFGMSYLYGLFGTTELAVLASKASSVAAMSGGSKVALLVAVIFFLSGIGYKVASVPWHMWCPDVYEGAPTPFTAFLSVAPKAAGFALATRFFMTALPGSAVPWQAILGVLAALTMTLGNLSALHQTSLKRLLAFSSIAHAGYLLMGLACGSIAGNLAVALYLSFYLLMNLGAFWVIQYVSAAGGSDSIADFRGLSKRAPVAAMAMTVFLFSLTGIPGLAGFVGKFYLFAATIQTAQQATGLASVGWWLLLLCAALNSAVALFYYARIVRAMFFERAPDEKKMALPWGQAGVFAVLAAAVIFFGIYWPPLSNVAQAVVHF